MKKMSGIRGMWVLGLVGGILLAGLGCSDDELKEAVIGSDAVQGVLCETASGVYNGSADFTDANGSTVPQTGTIVLNGDCNFAFSSQDPSGQPLSGSGTAAIEGSRLTVSGVGANGVPFTGTGTFSDGVSRLDTVISFQDGTRLSGSFSG
jgi:hypothetical protein